MLKPFNVTPEGLMEPQRTGSALPTLSSKPASPTLSAHQMKAAKTADLLFDLLPPLDVGDPKAFAAATIAILAGYPAEVLDQAVAAIAKRSDRPTLKFITEVCEELYAPIERRLERERAIDQHRRALPPPVDPASRPTLQDLEAKLGRKIGSAKRDTQGPPLSWDGQGPAPRAPDGKHMQRVAEDLAARKLRKELHGDAA